MNEHRTMRRGTDAYSHCIVEVSPDGTETVIATMNVLGVEDWKEQLVEMLRLKAANARLEEVNRQQRVALDALPRVDRRCPLSMNEARLVEIDDVRYLVPTEIFDEVTALQAALATLQAIVEKYPCFDDTGKPIVLGDTVFCHTEIHSEGVSEHRAYGLTGKSVLWLRRRVLPRPYYSTREAAEAAKGNTK